MFTVFLVNGGLNDGSRLQTEANQQKYIVLPDRTNTILRTKVELRMLNRVVIVFVSYRDVFSTSSLQRKKYQRQFISISSQSIDRHRRLNVDLIVELVGTPNVINRKAAQTFISGDRGVMRWSLFGVRISPDFAGL